MNRNQTIRPYEIPETFEEGLRRVLQVSREDMQQMLADEKKANAGKVKPGPKPKASSASGRASSRSR